MRKTGEQPHFAQAAENNQKINPPDLLTYTHAYPKVAEHQMTDGSNNGVMPKKRIEAGVTYNLRFNSKTQKKRIEDAAYKCHKTLRDFLLDLAEQAAAQFKETKEAKAS